MLKKIHPLLYSFINKHRHFPDAELFRYVLMFAVTLTAALIHIIFMVFYFAVGANVLAFSHLGGVLIFLLATFLLERGKHDLAGVLVSTMITVNTLGAILTIGGANCSILYFVIVLLLQLVVPFSNQKIPAFFGALIPLLMVASYLYDLNNAPALSIGIANTGLGVANIFVITSGVIILLSLEKVVRGFIDSYQQQRLSELQDQAYLDPLTKLYNRRYADEYFASLGKRDQDANVCLAIADIDDFKLVNDTHGHEAGDITLKTISTILLENTRKSDLAFRWGGEEFLLIIHGATKEDTFRLLDGIRQKISETPITSAGATFSVTITIGIARLDPQDVPGSLARCDRRLYAGKRRQGKNVVIQHGSE